MATNKYINNYNVASEQNLVDSLVIESIQMKGLDVKYIQREQAPEDVLMKEDSSNSFKYGKDIEMWPASVQGFDGDSMFTDFQLDIQKSCTFVVSKTRFAIEFPTIKVPRHGDLIYMPVTNALLEIKNVSQDSPFFENGKQFMYELETELFRFSYENISTDETEVDTLINSIMNTTEEDTPYGINTKNYEEVKNDYSFDPNNPFGE